MDLIKKAKEIKTEADQQSFFEVVAQEIEDLKKKENKPAQDKMIKESKTK